MYKEIETNKIVPKSNPRKDFGDMNELVASIKEHGILEPILVTKENELISGERRLRAAAILNIEKVPIKILETDSVTNEEIKIVENLQRKDLNPVEEGEAFQKYIKETKKSEEHLAKRLGKSVDYITRL